MDLTEFDVDINLYKIFYAVVKYGTFSSAAKNLGVSQPNISYSIKKLEEELGVSLFQRDNSLDLTPEGEAILPYIESALNTFKRAEIKVSDLVNLNYGQINIGVPSHIAVFLLVDIIKDFIKEYPNIKFKVVSKPTRELNKLLYANVIDVIIDSSPLDENIYNFIIKNISKEKMVFACNCNNKKFLDRKVSLKELKDEPLIVPLKSGSSTKVLIPIFEKYRMKFNPQFEVSTSDMIAEMVEENIGIGYLFEKTVEKYSKLKIIDLDVSFPEFNIYVIYKDNNVSISAEKFIKYIENH